MKYLLTTVLIALTAVTQVNGGLLPEQQPGIMTTSQRPQAAPVVAPGRSIDQTPYWLACPALVTAYSPHDPIDSEYVLTKGADRWKTSKRVDVRTTPYGLAVDPRALPYDTPVVIPGYLPVTAPNAIYRPDDTGGKLRQSWETKRLLHIDVRFATNDSANKWGVRYQVIWVQVTPASELERRLLAHNVRHQWLGKSLGLQAKVVVPE